MRLVEEWRTAWRWFSRHAMAPTVVIQADWATIPDDLNGIFPARIVSAVSVG